MRKPREELVKRGVLLEEPEQGESANELLSVSVWLIFSGQTSPLGDKCKGFLLK